MCWVRAAGRSEATIATLARPGSPAIVAEGLVKIYKTRKSEVRALDGVARVADVGRT